ncbi:uncharacterized protein LOC120342025 [Styela clava]|uniref:uncharacterized protein LOC120342025 n=1 Tax=Styela clava TaxID=7725 RepID=UPI00193A5F89|nr:uncharacterized protein LOC120342025 [Styela clava]
MNKALALLLLVGVAMILESEALRIIKPHPPILRRRFFRRRIIVPWRRRIFRRRFFRRRIFRGRVYDERPIDDEEGDQFEDTNNFEDIMDNPEVFNHDIDEQDVADLFQ